MSKLNFAHREPLDIIGADVSSTEIVLAWAGAHKAPQTIPNTHKSIVSWLKHLAGKTIIGVEATGRWHQTLADCATAHGHTVYVINPKQLLRYAAGVGQRGKTDQLDAAVIARYIDRERDDLFVYRIPTPVQATLRALLAQRASIVKHRTAIQLSLAATSSTQGQATLKRARRAMLDSMQALLVALDEQLTLTIQADPLLEVKRHLLLTINGIGLLNSIALTHRLSRTTFANSDALIAAYGLDPRPKESGKYVGRRALSKQGNSEDRRLIYMAAQSASKSQVFKPYYQALRAKGFATTQAIVIIARKLLRIALAVWTTGQVFDATKLGFVSSLKRAHTSPCSA